MENFKRKGYNLLYAPHPCKMTLPSIARISHLLFDEDKCDRFLLDNGCYYREYTCDGCGSNVRPQLEQKRFRCGVSSCRREWSLKKHTFFEASRLKSHEILHLGYLWLNRNSQTQAVVATGHSSRTVTKFFKHFRQLVSSTLDEEDQFIGGPNVEVEIDETKLGKRKYNRGHRVEGVWIIVGVERTPERRVFMERVEDRSAATLREVIGRHVLAGSIVLTDMWKGYAGLDEHLNVTHKTVNHSRFFKDPETGVHTNTVEGTNNALKIMIKPRNRTKEADNHLGEFVWRRKNAQDLWNGFITAMRDVHYDIE
jgi:transposase-like protein